ncbi:MAG: hypothetical protein RTU92_08165 [Candidatus Thorarchaeota archaeon]
MKRRNTVLLSIALFGILLILPSLVAGHSQGLYCFVYPEPIITSLSISGIILTSMTVAVIWIRKGK